MRYVHDGCIDVKHLNQEPEYYTLNQVVVHDFCIECNIRNFILPEEMQNADISNNEDDYFFNTKCGSCGGNIATPIIGDVDILKDNKEEVNESK